MHGGLAPTLAALFLLALSLRALLTRSLVPLLNGEEAEHARIAENLFHRQGYSGVFGGAQLAHAPLFPLLTAFFYVLLRDGRLAGLAVSMLAGAALSPLLYLTARLIAGRLGALYTALAALFLPLLIYLSGTLYSESLYWA